MRSLFDAENAFLGMQFIEGEGVDAGEVKELAAVGEEAVVYFQLLVEGGSGAPLKLADDKSFVTEVEGLVAGLNKRLVTLRPDEVVGVEVGNAHRGEGGWISDEWGRETGNNDFVVEQNGSATRRGDGHCACAAAGEFAGDGGGTAAAEARQGAVRAVEDGGGVVADVVVDAGKCQQLACGRGGGDAIGGDSGSQCNSHVF